MRDRAGQSLRVGVLATLCMDVALLAAARLAGEAFTSDKISPGLVGRWAAGLARGRYRHEDLASEAPLQGEFCIGMAVHYMTGVGLTGTYLQGLRRLQRRPGVASGAAYGAATALLPWLIMYPCWGLGPFGSRSGEMGRLVRIMLLGHTVFGAAIGAWAIALTEESPPTATTPV